VIQANCRAQFTADDFSFVVRVLAKSQLDAVSLVSSPETKNPFGVTHAYFSDSL